jgi:hypothetical protein
MSTAANMHEGNWAVAVSPRPSTSRKAMGGPSHLPDLLLLSTGFWAPFIYSHWLIAQTNWVTAMSFWASFPGAEALTILSMSVIAIVFRRHGRPNSDTALCKWADYLLTLGLILSGGLTIIGRQMGNPPLAIAAFCSAAIWQSWFLLRWWTTFAYERTMSVALSLCAGIIIVSVMKIIMAAIPDTFPILVLAACIMSTASLHIVKRGKHGDLWFNRETGASVLPLTLSVAIFMTIWALVNAVLKSATGHYGFETPGAVTLSTLAQSIDIAVALFIIWWLRCKKGPLPYFGLWRAAFVMLAARDCGQKVGPRMGPGWSLACPIRWSSGSGWSASTGRAG